MTRLKLAELTSGVGALVLGVGIGALFPQWFAPAAVLVTVAGVLLHGFGMWDKRRLEGASTPENGRMVAALYWACWLLLGAVVIVLFRQ
jgi:hypothetical protein